MENEHGWTPEEYETTINELEAIGFYVSHPGVMTRAAGPVPLVVDLLPTDDTRPGWVRMSAPNGALVELVKATNRAASAEAEVALLRQALQKGLVALTEAQSLLNSLGTFATTGIVSRALSACEDALNGTNAGQPLLDRIKTPEEQVQQLTKERDTILTAQIPQTYNEGDPADCARVAVDWMKRAAGLCASACGALADGDHPTTGSIRSTLLEFRSRLNTMAHVIENRELADHLKETTP